MFKLIVVGSLICSVSILIQNCESHPLQFLPSREGYVPVYIRHGDTPLNEINPELAVAFHETGISSRSRKDKSADDQLMLGDEPARVPSSDSKSSKKPDEKKDNSESDVLDIEKFEKKFGKDESKSSESDESKSSESDESTEKSVSSSKQSEPERPSSAVYNTPLSSERPLSVPEPTSSISSVLAG